MKRFTCWLALPLLTAAVLLGAYNESVSRDQQRQLDALELQLRGFRGEPARHDRSLQRIHLLPTGPVKPSPIGPDDCPCAQCGLEENR